MKGLTVIGVEWGAWGAWSVVAPTTGVILLDIECSRVRSPAPLHWMVGDWTKPPVDVSINNADATVQAVQIVLQDEAVPRVELELPVPLAEGMPQVDVEGWPENRYLDVTAEVRTMRGSDGQLVVEFGNYPAKFWCGEPGLVAFGWNWQKELCQVMTGPLSSDEWSMIDNLA